MLCFTLFVFFFSLFVSTSAVLVYPLDFKESGILSETQDKIDRSVCFPGIIMQCALRQLIHSDALPPTPNYYRLMIALLLIKSELVSNFRTPHTLPISLSLSLSLSLSDSNLEKRSWLFLRQNLLKQPNYSPVYLDFATWPKKKRISSC